MNMIQYDMKQPTQNYLYYDEKIGLLQGHKVRVDIYFETFLYSSKYQTKHIILWRCKWLISFY